MANGQVVEKGVLRVVLLIDVRGKQQDGIKAAWMDCAKAFVMVALMDRKLVGWWECLQVDQKDCKTVEYLVEWKADPMVAWWEF